MILIADSGSTKTNWCVVEHGQVVRQVLSKGMNPYFQSEEDIVDELINKIQPELPTKVFESIYFYGAGCTPEKIPMMEAILRKQFEVSGTVKVDTDMLGAAHGLCGDEPGIVCILGTGSNSCYYDGENMAANVSPLGFILGDEGSGAVLGKLLVGDILKNQTSPEIKEKFLKQFNLTPGDVIEKVYRQPFPNRFLASVSPFLAQNIHEPELRTLVLNSFISFFKRNVMQYDYKTYTVNLIGSVAYYYKEVLLEAAKATGLTIGKIEQSPMEGLVVYHSKK
ncbi:ATPase [Bacteroides sp. 214]|uniref:ATPase n=1 Tax=Bacteroides sp. 214 TaxID=2302935 RepID=UPI0013D4EB01|nr:ATPase [Bacteroides sp. 214]NDW12523.1 ATPase [Bacteroides sp. 214]